MDGPRFAVGIDLGTTNSAVAFADLRQLTPAGTPAVRVFAIPQLVAESEVAHRDTLPSFLYLLSDEERQSGGFGLPWARSPARVAGTWAREQGALVPGRLVTSAKSWLCNDAVDRRARLLPWGGDEAPRACSPVEASADYLGHVRDAWNHVMAAGAADACQRLERQAVALTVPASFDEEARELTVEAARLAGLEELVLLEEPTAALYAWIAGHRGRLADHLHDGDRLLVCDVGGGTTDFTLVSIGFEGGEPRLERTSVGQHLLLGGDNLDLALVRHVEEKLGRPRLTLRQQQALRRQCAAVKERILGPPPVARATVSVLGSGGAVVGGALSTVVTRDEVLALLLDGFLPECPADTSPSVDRRAGLRELGLPFANDPGITRHLARFLREAGEGRPVRPDAILFNGGFFTPVEARDRVSAVVAGWYPESEPGWTPRVLANASPATAVAEGAAYSGLVKRGYGVRVGGGSPRAYLLALGGEASAEGRLETVCVVPRGTEEGSSFEVPERDFNVQANQPLAFTLLSSVTGRHALGEVVDLADAPHVHRHAPLVTELRFGKRSRQPQVQVGLHVILTELGTLELWLVARGTDHRWRLQFQLRGAVRDTRATASVEDAPASAVLNPDALEAAATSIREIFGSAATASPATPETIMSRLEETLGFGKHAWPLAAVRPLADVLIETIDGRRRSARHEARWLNLLGYCLRPGFGATLDEWRMTQARRLYLAGPAFPGDVQVQAEWLVLWQRVAGGLTPGQQQEVFDRHAALVGLGSARRPKRLPPQVEREALRLLASLEQVSVNRRVALGDDLLARLRRDPRSSSLLWALGRVGARVPVRAPLNAVVPPARAAGWAAALVDLLPVDEELARVVVQMLARTGDPVRDVEEAFRRNVHGRLAEGGAAPEVLRRLLEIEAPSEVEARRAYGEALPEGLRLVADAGKTPVAVAVRTADASVKEEA